MKLQLARPRRWPFGKFTSYRTASRQRLGIHLNRYEGEVIGVAMTWRRRCMSWVSPVWLVGLRITDEQLEREHRDLLASNPEDQT